VLVLLGRRLIDWARSLRNGQTHGLQEQAMIWLRYFLKVRLQFRSLNHSTNETCWCESFLNGHQCAASRNAMLFIGTQLIVTSGKRLQMRLDLLIV
jgi:hypothetical protein